MLRYTLAMQAVIAKPFGAVGGTVWGGGKEGAECVIVVPWTKLILYMTISKHRFQIQL